MCISSVASDIWGTDSWCGQTERWASSVYRIVFGGRQVHASKSSMFGQWLGSRWDSGGGKKLPLWSCPFPSVWKTGRNHFPVFLYLLDYLFALCMFLVLSTPFLVYTKARPPLGECVGVKGGEGDTEWIVPSLLPPGARPGSIMLRGVRWPGKGKTETSGRWSWRIRLERQLGDFAGVGNATETENNWAPWGKRL